MIAPLCILQARHHSTRLPGKMLLPLGGETLIARGWRTACAAFGPAHCVVAIPASDEAGPLGQELARLDARTFAWDGPESDVLSRFYHCAHRYRWHPDSVIMRYTPDDPFKSIDALMRVVRGDRLPVELGGEAFTLGMLDAAQDRAAVEDEAREHITRALFPTAPPPAPPGVWTIDTQGDYEAACEIVAARRGASPLPFDRGMY
jgi:spore coat polysaccharide biosynthesis protein SpsF (cytidylyltransferase family)